MLPHVLLGPGDMSGATAAVLGSLRERALQRDSVSSIQLSHPIFFKGPFAGSNFSRSTHTRARARRSSPITTPTLRTGAVQDLAKAG